MKCNELTDSCKDTNCCSVRYWETLFSDWGSVIIAARRTVLARSGFINLHPTKTCGILCLLAMAVFLISLSSCRLSLTFLSFLARPPLLSAFLYFRTGTY